MKKILVYAHYYYPDVASTGQILTELCEGLTDQYDVTVICTVPSYGGKIEDKYKKQKYYFEEINDVHVVRVSVPEFDKANKMSRIKNIISYYKSAIKITKKLGHFDLVYTISQPPILGGLLGLKGKKITKGKLIYNIQDFNPEQILAVNYSKSKLITNLLLKIDKKTCRNSDLIITVGKDMQDTLRTRFKNEEIPNNVVINNWINEKEIYPLDKNDKKIIEFKKKYNLENKFIIMYSGNLGLYYDLENIIKLFKGYKDNNNVAFVFVGEGGIKKKLIEYKNDNNMDNVYFIPYQDKKDLNISLNVADIHLVTNAKGIKGVSVPSKIYGCLATNIPVFGILEKGSEAWNIIEKSNCGVLSETGNYNDIKHNLDEIIKNKNKFIKNHLTGRKHLEDNYTKDKSIKKYRNELDKISKKNNFKDKIKFDDIIFYIATFLIPFENLCFAPSSGWATIAPIIFALYLLLNIKDVIKEIKIKDVIPLVLLILALNIFNYFTKDFNLIRFGNSAVTLGLGVNLYFSFKTYYKKHKNLNKVVNILLFSYLISLLVGTIQFIAIKNHSIDVLNIFKIIGKRTNYLFNGRVQYTFTEPSYISMHLFGILLPLYFVTKNKKIIIIIFSFLILSYLFNSGVRILLDALIILIILTICWILNNKKRIKYLLIGISLISLFSIYLYNNNSRVKSIVNGGIYADASLASRFFRIESTIYGYTYNPIDFIIGYGFGNSIIPVTQGYHTAMENYKNAYVYEVESQNEYKNKSNDNATFCLYLRIISEFGIIVFIYLLYRFIILFKNSSFKYKYPLAMVTAYLYIQFDSYAFYTLWLLFVILVYTKKEE